MQQKTESVKRKNRLEASSRGFGAKEDLIFERLVAGHIVRLPPAVLLSLSNCRRFLDSVESGITQEGLNRGQRKAGKWRRGTAHHSANSKSCFLWLHVPI